MRKDKQERHRLKRAQKRRGQHLRTTQLSKAAGKHARVMKITEEADDAVERGDFVSAAESMAEANRLIPRDPMLAQMWVYAAERTGDPRLRREALEHYCSVAEPDVTAVLALAWLCRAAGDDRKALDLTRQARSRLPRRMKDRARWRRTLEDLESYYSTVPVFLETPDVRPAETLPLFAEATPAGAERKPPSRIEEFTERSVEARPSPPPSSTPADEQPAFAPLEAPQPAPLEIAVEVSTEIDALGCLERAPTWSQEDLELAVLAAQIRDAESFDRLLAAENAHGLLRLSHQEETARKVLSVLLGRALLADEVGLGKTIEAGLVLCEYLLRGRVQDALILAPPTLVNQWREELESKFAIACRTTEDAVFRSGPERFWSDRGIVVASLATARSPRQRDFVTGRKWDLLIVDEAHVVKNARTESYALVSRIQSRFLLLLTATPIENRVEELYNLVSLIRPGQLGGRRDFLRRFSDNRGRPSEAARREVRALLGEVMIRNTRALSGVRLPPRFARTALVEPIETERGLYEHLVTALRALGTKGRTRLLLSVLLQEAGSSPHAVRSTLLKLRSNSDLPAHASEALTPAIDFAEHAADTGKGIALLGALENSGPTVVFTRFRATLDFLASLLGRHGLPFERMDGDVPPPARHQAIARLRERGGVLLSTDVGSEGLNLQFCRRIVNFDLPWNPMRIEQRIGRIHRIGQDQAVEVVNLCLAGSIEERILRILDERINLFELVVGEVEMILGYLEDTREFPDLVLDAFAEPDIEQRERSLLRIADQLAAARRRYASVKSFDEEFFRSQLSV